MREATKWKNFNPIVAYEAVSELESKDALNKAFRILFREIRRDEIEKRKALNSQENIDAQAENISNVSL